MSSSAKEQLTKIFSLAGITIDGNKPYDIQVRSESFYQRVLAQNSMGLGESYMDGWWECEKLDQFFYQVMSHHLDRHIKPTWQLGWQVAKAKMFNLQSRQRAFIAGERHYDIGNDLFQLMLGKTMAYSCGYWLKAKNLDDAQVAKFDLICRKLQLEKGMTLLDIGCGWGTLMKYAVEQYGVRAVGITVSKEQVTLAKELTKGLPIEIRLQDYRLLNEKFDRVVSVGMFEHVGHKNYKEFMNVVSRNLAGDGLFLLHTIGWPESVTATDPWVEKYIFPNSMLPSATHIAKAAEKLFVMEDWHNFGSNYDPTLVAWYENFDNNWPALKEKYGQRFYRMWRYYLLSCAGLFRSRQGQLWQVVFSRDGVPGGYKSIR